MLDLNYIYSFLKDSKKEYFHDFLIGLPYEEQKYFFESIIKDERVIEFLNNTNKYICNLSQSTKYSYLKKRLTLIGLTNIGSDYWAYHFIDAEYLNNLLTIINFILKNVNIPQP